MPQNRPHPLLRSHTPDSAAWPQIVYCNAEGISWIDHYRIVIASDKAKSNQPFWLACSSCLAATAALVPPLPSALLRPRVAGQVVPRCAGMIRFC